MTSRRPGFARRHKVDLGVGGMIGRGVDRNDDRGGGLIATVVTCAVLMVVVTSAMTPVSRALIDRQRARSAADAAALGGVVDGASGALRAAERNGAQLLSYRESGYEVTVIVKVGQQSVTARATDAP